MRRSIFVALLASLALLLPVAGMGAGPNERQVIMALTEVATGAPVSVTLTNQTHTTGYLVVKTENETATASLVVTVLNSTELGDFLICTSAAITTDTTTAFLIGSTVAAGQGVTTACDFAASSLVKFTFTTSGGGADFDTTANMEWVTNN